MSIRLLGVMLIGLVAVISVPATAQNTEIRHVSFTPGTTSAELTGSIKGDQIVDYVLGASIGQRMVLDMTTSNASAYFNVMLEDAPEAIHVGSIYGLHYDAALPASGDWVIRVYLMRNAARRGEVADYTIDVNIDAVGAATLGGPEKVCLAEVVRITNTAEVEVIGSDFSEAGTMVRLVVGSNSAPWQCIAYKDGSTAGVMFLGDDSAGTTSTPGQTYADGDAGGPDWWQVTGAASLNIRSGPGTGQAVVGKAARGQILRNLGCHGTGEFRERFRGLASCFACMDTHIWD